MLEKEPDDEVLTYDQVAETIIDLGNRMLAEDESADILEVASGIMAGAVQFWLYSRQPCKDPFCDVCADISTAERRLTALLQETHVLIEESDYYCSANDVITGTA
ncbi:MAG: hypothetical protein GY727_04515 [Gammaproteobacteria bacterium]|nr:hypothetical protein [Gammaproteobacteria bacterium]MCP4090105.1 hypothetical protein [Gammaproteobacteria bacterium]MCP4277005.1 hypothetical protein [Gammaproteobacteria bacterium]MCP4832772.1 hypothetical protein [Gammaproteobacteria bacterium]MCP4929965.1 hypothetical protein [Gammaproteobacteria bacterium]